MLKTIWQEFLKIAHEEEGSRVVETWLKAVFLEQWDPVSKKALLRAPNAFVRDWIKSHYMNLFTIHLSRLLNVPSLEVLVMAEKQVPPLEAKALHIVPARTITDIVPQKPMVPKEQPKQWGQLNENYSFETFVVGSNNSLAYAAARAVTEKPGRLYNPLFIYGDSGLGKTHLLHAIGNRIKKNSSGLVILYQTADRFVNEFINAIRFNKVTKFKEKYQGIDILLVDDIQFISNKDQTQEAFFHIFNALYESGKQIVFTSDTFPRNIEGLAERLYSRLEWGLVADIQIPSVETKIAILQKKAALNNEKIPEDVAQFIAYRTISNIRELEGALIRVLAFASLTKQPLTLELAKKVLVHPQAQRLAEIDFEKIMTGLGQFYPYSLNDLRSKNRNKEIAFVRQVAMYLMKKLTQKSLQEIGEFLRRKNHSTVLYAFDRIENYIQQDEQFKNRLQLIERKIVECGT